MSCRLRTIFALVLILAFSDAGAAVRVRSRRVQADTVALGCRGVMENFPRVAEGLEERLSFYCAKGLTHYFYCPSDDKYCNRWGWKFLYNDNERHLVRGICSLVSEKGMEFVWTVNPGERYNWKQDDYKFLLDKLIMMYYNGIRSFAVDLTDSPGDYAAVRDSLEKNFVATRKDKVQLYMIDDLPSVAYPSKGYSAVESMMNGYDFDTEFLDRVKSVDALLCNLSTMDEFAKLAVCAVADCSADPDQYQADKSMTDAIESLDDTIRDSFLTFLRHTGNSGQSKGVRTFTVDDWSKEKADALYQEFDRIEKVPVFMGSRTDSEVIDALQPWLSQFGRLGTRGKNVLECMEHYINGELGQFWVTYQSSFMTAQQVEEYERHPVGEEVLHPFCTNAMAEMKEGFTSMLTGRTALHNLASTLYSTPNEALDSDFETSLRTDGEMAFAIPARANTCHLLTGPVPDGELILFRQLRTDGSLVAEFILKSPFTTFDLKEGAVKVDVLGNIDIYETIFVDLHP